MSSFSFNAITTLWQHIEQFLPLEDTITISKTCKALHTKCIDSNTLKVKVSHFTWIRSPDVYAKYLPWALNCIHFPSLRRLQYPPFTFTGKMILYGQHYGAKTDWENRNSEITGTFARDIKEAIIACFPIIAVNLSLARNLESLLLHSNSLMQAECNGQSLKWILAALGRNLQNCTKLSELKVYNFGVAQAVGGRNPSTFYSVGLMEAISTVISKRSSDLETLEIQIGGLPTDSDYESRDQCKVSTDFFAAIFSARKLKSLHILVTLSSFYGPSLVANSLLKVSGNGLNAFNIRELKELTLELHLASPLDDTGHIGLPDEDELQCQYPIVPLISHFSNCHSIQQEQLKIPRNFWSERESFSTFIKLVANKAELDTLVCNFDNYNDNDGRVFDLLEEIIQDSSHDYLFLYLGCVNTEKLRSFGKHFAKCEVKLKNGDDLSDCKKNTVDVFTLLLDKHTIS